MRVVRVAERRVVRALRVERWVWVWDAVAESVGGGFGCCWSCFWGGTDGRWVLR